MSRDPDECRRSDCPLSIALEILGDRWTLLILRDLFFKQFSTFKQFQESGEGIATNILSDRLRLLQGHEIISRSQSPEDARIAIYRPTGKGLALLPAIIELILWTATYHKTAAPPELVRAMRTDRKAFIRKVESRFTDKPR
jgi:DNA-binding HxlR family transcriptional regulator